MSLFFILVLLNSVVLHYGKKKSDFFPMRHMLACYMLGPPTRRVVGLIPADSVTCLSVTVIKKPHKYPRAIRCRTVIGNLLVPLSLRTLQLRVSLTCY